MDKNGSTKSKHITWIDTAKGLGLLLVVFGHLLFRSKLIKTHRAIYSFHVPLYFISAGFVSKIKENESFKDFTRKKFYRILCPALILMVITTPFYFIENRIFSINTLNRFFFFGGITTFNDPCWFFVVLFEVLIIDRLLEGIFKDIKSKIWLCCLSLILGYIVYDYKILIPFGLNRAVIAYFFFLFGNIINYFYTKYEEKITKAWTLLMPIFLIIWYYTGVILNIKVSMYNFRLGNYWCFIASGIFGTLCFWWLCRIIEKYTKIFQEWSKNTVFLICSHYVFACTFRQLAIKTGNIRRVRYNIAAVIFTILLVVGYQKISKFINKKLPLLNGRYNPEKTKKT